MAPIWVRFIGCFCAVCKIRGWQNLMISRHINSFIRLFGSNRGVITQIGILGPYMRKSILLRVRCVYVIVET